MADREKIVAAVQDMAIEGELACADAHDIAQQLDIAPMDVGRVVNKATELRFFRCQLGVFGYGLKSEGKSKIVSAAAHVPDDIRAAIEACAVDGRLSCLAVWEIADQFKYPRLGIANIAEAMELRIMPCQLGCF